MRSVPDVRLVRMMMVLWKSMEPPLAVLHDALVEDLEKDFVYVRVRLFHLVEQHDRIRLARRTASVNTPPSP